LGEQALRTEGKGTQGLGGLSRNPSLSELKNLVNTIAPLLDERQGEKPKAKGGKWLAVKNQKKTKEEQEPNGITTRENTNNLEKRNHGSESEPK